MTLFFILRRNATMPPVLSSAPLSDNSEIYGKYELYYQYQDYPIDRGTIFYREIFGFLTQNFLDFLNTKFFVKF